MMKATVDPNQCIGCELCVGICPDVFTMEDNISTVIVDSVPTDVEPACREATESCPVTAITITE